MNISQERKNRLSDMQKGYLTLIIGIPFSMVVVSGVYLSLGLSLGLPPPGESSLLFTIDFSLFVVFGLLGGYITKRDYLRAWAYWCATFF